MDIKNFFGELSKDEIINLNDKVSVKIKEENGNIKTITGILIEATPERIKINGTSPIQDIDSEKILEIEKINNST